jgi:formate dehydrogenase maturation protein FdhE
MNILKSLSIVAVVSLILFTNVFAQVEPEILPDDPLYQAKREKETAQLNAELDPLKKANLYTKYAKERLQEIKTMVSKGKPEFVDGLVEDYEKAVSGALEEINKAQAQGRDVSKALEAVESATKKHTEVLTDLLGKVPEQAKPAITHAIEVSKHGRNRALDVLNKIQRVEFPIGKPEGSGKPAGIPAGRSGGKGKGR